MITDLALVVGGGIAGATARWAVGAIVDHATIALIIVNALGAFLLGALVRRRPAPTARRRLWLGVGFCGALTTFSTLTVDIADRLDAGQPGAAVRNLTLVVGIGLVAALAGNATGSRDRKGAR